MMYCEHTSLAPQLSKPASQLSISELEMLLLKPKKQATIPFSHIKKLMSDDGFAGSSLRINLGVGGTENVIKFAV
jgi:hypothetical protein